MAALTVQTAIFNEHDKNSRKGGKATTIATNKQKTKKLNKNKTNKKLTATTTKQNKNCCVCNLFFNRAVVLFRFGRPFTIMSAAGAWVKISSGE